jgi:predicted DNA-binding transcriptional regulator AlpA
MTMLTAVQHLVGSAEIGRMLGVNRQRVQQLINTRDFPQPEAELAMGKVWNRDDIVAWARSHGRAIPDGDES